MQEEYFDEEAYRRRMKRREEARRKKREKRRRQLLLYKAILAAACFAVIVLIGCAISKFIPRPAEKSLGSETDLQGDSEEGFDPDETDGGDYAYSAEGLKASEAPEAGMEEQIISISGNISGDTLSEAGRPEGEHSADYYAFSDEGSAYMGSSEMTSQYGLLVNVEDRQVVAAKNAYDRISPASMTKILTALVACENIENLDDMYTVTIEATDFAYRNDCSSAGFMDGEKVTIRDLLHGTILPSGGEAAYALACYTAGSQEAFVDMMNEKLSQLGLSDTAHFTNCVGLYDEDHYCTLYDMAVILEAAMENEECARVLSAHRYTTSLTPQHPDGIDLSNLFLRRIEDKETGGMVIGAKTGFVVQSGNCAASFYTREDGSNFICVTANAHSAWRCIYDHVAAYNIYAAGNTDYRKE